MGTCLGFCHGSQWTNRIYFSEVCFVTNFAGIHIFLKAKILCFEMYGNLGVAALQLQC